MAIPDYPEWAERDGITGEVSAKIWVMPEGHVNNLVQVIRVSTEQRFNDLALDAVRQWRFARRPKAHGKQWGIVTFHFKLQYPKPGASPWTRTVMSASERPFVEVALN